MKASALREMPDGITPISAFASSFVSDLVSYERGLSITGGSAPVTVTEDAAFRISINDVQKLCKLFVDGSLSNSELAYLADAMQLADSITFENEWVADAVAAFTDPEINGPFTREAAEQLMNGPHS